MDRDHIMDVAKATSSPATPGDFRRETSPPESEASADHVAAVIIPLAESIHSLLQETGLPAECLRERRFPF